MKDYDNVHFLLIGQGDEVSLVQQYIFEHALKNCTYLPSISQEEYKAVLKCVDIGLFSLARNHSIHNFPGKLLGYMANKLPILGSVNEGNDLKDVVSQAGAGFKIHCYVGIIEDLTIFKFIKMEREIWDYQPLNPILYRS